MKQFLITSSAISVVISGAAAITGSTQLLGLNMTLGSVNGLVFHTIMFGKNSQNK